MKQKKVSMLVLKVYFVVKVLDISWLLKTFFMAKILGPSVPSFIVTRISEYVKKNTIYITN